MPTHGKRSTYYDHGCRCEACTEAKNNFKFKLADSELRRKLPVEPLSEAMPEDMRRRHRDSLIRWKKTGGISLYAADKMACQIGLHPYVIWGDEWFFRINKNAFIKC